MDRFLKKCTLGSKLAHATFALPQAASGNSAYGPRKPEKIPEPILPQST
jgi:hypothetical protein